MKIYTIGYLGRTIDEFLDILKREDGALLDIRISPKSRKPGYSEKALKAKLGDDYLWMPEFGNVNYGGGPIELADPEFGLELIEATVKDSIEDDWQGAIFLMCACREAATCHRTTVAQLLRDHGYEVSEYSG